MKIAVVKEPPRRKPTVSDVARQAGVSAGSVSRVLTGKNWVSDELRKQVMAAARALMRAFTREAAIRPQTSTSNAPAMCATQ